MSPSASFDSPKQVALLACESEPVPPGRALTLEGGGRTLVIGEGKDALEAAHKLSADAGVSVLLSKPLDSITASGFDVYAGKPLSVQGHFGAFQVQIRELTSLQTSPESGTVVSGESNIETDVILDLSRSPSLLAAPHLRDGYIRADPRKPGAVEEAVSEIKNLKGTFEKPIFVEVRNDRCAHARSKRIGCTRCLDTCPPSALSPGTDHVDLDPYACAGCGSCASVCPTGALRIDHPAEEATLRKLRTLLRTFRESGGTSPLLILHGEGFAEQMLEAVKENGDLPEHVLPFPLGEITRAGTELFWISLAYGAERIICILDPARADEQTPLKEGTRLANTLTEALGAGSPVVLFDEPDPETLRKTLDAPMHGTRHPCADFLALGERREVARHALRHLHAHAPNAPNVIALPSGAPYGEIEVSDACTLCLACVGGCPTGALQDDPDTPKLGFLEEACIQCGICRNTCPEDAITLHPRLSLKDTAHSVRTLREEEPFACVSCGKPFGVRKSIERTIERLAGHAMLSADPRMAQRLRMCADCRVIDQFREGKTDMPSRPRVRTSDNYQGRGSVGSSGKGEDE